MPIVVKFSFSTKGGAKKLPSSHGMEQVSSLNKNYFQIFTFSLVFVWRNSDHRNIGAVFILVQVI